MKTLTVIFTPKTVNCLRHYIIDAFDDEDASLTTIAKGCAIQQDETLEELAQYILYQVVGRMVLMAYDEFYFRDGYDNKSYRRYIE